MANNDKENKIEKFTKEAIGKTLNQFNKEIGMADLVEINKNQDRILNGILSQVNDENTEKTEKSNIITLDNSTDGIVELKEIQGDTNVNVSKIEEDMPITHDIGDKEGNVFNLNEITQGAISIGEIQGNTMVNCNKDDKKELVLMKDLSTQGDNTVTITEGVDGGLVDVTLEGNTLVNVSKTKDITALPLEEELTYLYANTQYTVQFISDKAITADITLGGTSLLAQSIIKGLNRISITTPETLVDNKLIISGVGANISKVVATDTGRKFGYFEGMKSVGECEELEITSSNSDNSASNTQQLTHEPLRGIGEVRDRYVLIDGKWYIEKKYGVRAYQEGDKDNYKTDLINTVYPLEMPTYEEIDYNPLEVYSGTTHISTNSTIPATIIVKNHGFNCLLKPSTTYTISSNLGLNTVTTPSTLTEDCLRFMDTDTSDVTTMKDVLVLEGDWTTKANLIPANFSGMESAFEQELVTDEADTNFGKYKVNAKVVGKNLFDINKIIVGEKADGQINRNYSCSQFIKVVPNATYILKNYDNYRFDGIVQYSRDKVNLKSNISVTTSMGKFTTGNSCYYIKVQIYNNSWATFDCNVQLERGDTATEYEPYKESNITFYINEPLRGVGDVKDRIYVKDDKVVVQRNCEKVTFDGSVDEVVILRDTKAKVLHFEVNIPLSLNHSIGSKTLSNSLPSIPNNNWNNDVEGVLIMNGITTLIRIYIDKNKLQTQDIAGFRQWLQQNPTTVVYQLAEPIYEEVEYSSNRLILDTFNNESFNNSTLFLDTNISPKISFKPLWEELVYVKSNTKYYIQFNAVGSGEVVINLGGTELTTEIVEGCNCIPITTPSESTNLMTISGQGITISEVIVSEVVCGGYYKGLQSCFEEHMENGKYRVLLRGIALDGSKVNGIKLYINEPLRGIEGIKDRLCIKNGKLMVERKCGSEVFDGSDDEGWTLIKTNTNTIAFGYKKLGIKNISTLISNIFINANIYSGDLECVWCNDMQNIQIQINQSKLSTQDVVGFKQWLQQNPLIVVYQLAKPTYEEVTNEYGLPIIFEGYENGIVYIDSAVTPTTHIKYTSNNQLATTLSEAEEQNIATQEDINMNVITYMMDIDMILTDMEMSNDISVMAVRRDSSNENMLDRMSDEDKKVYRDNTVVMLEKMITANVLEKEDIERRINMYYDKNRISKEQYEYLKSLL